MKRILFCLLAAAAVFVVAKSSEDAAARKHHPKGHYKGHYAKTGWHHHHFVDGPRRPYVRRSIDGALVDREGWRFWNGNWDNTCFRTLDYLSSMSACSGGGAG